MKNLTKGAPLIEPWLSEKIRSRLVPHEQEAVAGAFPLEFTYREK